jgi:hypothetical protein
MEFRTDPFLVLDRALCPTSVARDRAKWHQLSDCGATQYHLIVTQHLAPPQRFRQDDNPHTSTNVFLQPERCQIHDSRNGEKSIQRQSAQYHA